MASTTIGSRKRSHSDMRFQNAPSKLIDEEIYRTTVLRLPLGSTEDEMDESVAQEAHNLGLAPVRPINDIQGITSSLSGTTIASDSIHQGSIVSQSTAPTSCSSSEHRPVTQSSQVSERSLPASKAPSFTSETEKKPYSAFRKNIRKMAGFRKRKSATLSTSTLPGMITISKTANGDHLIVKSDLKSPASGESGKSSWSTPVSATKFSYEQPPPPDDDATRRSMDCTDMLRVRNCQLEERLRFLDFEASLIRELRTRRDTLRSTRKQVHARIVEEQIAKVGGRFDCMMPANPSIERKVY